jgi:hypothetical protein
MMGGGGSAGMLGMMAAWTGMRAGGWALGKVGHLGRQVIRSPYNAGRYVRDRAKGIDWTSRTAKPSTGIPGPKHVDAYRIPDLDNGPRQLPPPPPPAIGGAGPRAIAPSGPTGNLPVPRPPSGGPPATRPPGPRRPPSPSGRDGPYQAPYRRDPRRPATPIQNGRVTPGHDGRRQLGPGPTTSSAPEGRLARDSRNGHWVSVPDDTVVGPAGFYLPPLAPPPPPPPSTGKPTAPVQQNAPDPRPEPRVRRIARSLRIRRRITPLDDGPTANPS